MVCWPKTNEISPKLIDSEKKECHHFFMSILVNRFVCLLFSTFKAKRKHSFFSKVLIYQCLLLFLFQLLLCIAEEERNRKKRGEDRLAPFVPVSREQQQVKPVVFIKAEHRLLSPLSRTCIWTTKAHSPAAKREREKAKDGSSSKKGHFLYEPRYFL